MRSWNADILEIRLRAWKPAFPMPKLKDFQNDGFGWYCRHCAKELPRKRSTKSRLFSEGEAESKSPEMSTEALAKWADAARTRLMCPRCGITESVEIR